jgi:hypothetical protein
MIVPIRTSLAVLAASMIGDRGIHPVMSYRRRISRDLLPTAGERQRGLVHLKILRRRPALSSCSRQSPVRTWKLATARSATLMPRCCTRAASTLGPRRSSGSWRCSLVTRGPLLRSRTSFRGSGAQAASGGAAGLSRHVRAGMPAVTGARSLIACRRVVPDVFEAVLLRLAVIVLAVLAWH